MGSGEVVKKDFDLAAAGGARAGVKEGDVIKLDEMVVDAPREMTGAAFAINEQRHAAMADTDIEPGMTLQHAAIDQRADRDGLLGGKANDDVEVEAP